MYNIEIKKLNYSTIVFVDGINWSSLEHSHKKSVINHAVNLIDEHFNIPPEFIDKLEEDAFKDMNFLMKVLKVANGIVGEVGSDEFNTIIFKI